MTFWHPLGSFGAYSFPVELAVLVGVGIASWIARARIVALVRRRADAVGPRGIWVVALVSLVVCTACAGWVLDRFPNSADEYGDLFLAETLSRGRLWNDIHPLQEFFSFVHIAEKDGKWVSRFPPGWALVLLAAGSIGLPTWLVNPLLAALTLVGVYGFTLRLADRRCAWIAAAVTAGSGYFVFTSASYRSHPLTALLLILFAWGLTIFVQERRAAFGLLAGLALGCAFLTRPYTALLCGLPFAAYFLFTTPRRQWWSAALVVLGALPPVAFLLFYNQSITGSPWLPVTIWMDPQEGLGFVKDHGPGRGLAMMMRRLFSFVEWTAPTLLPLYAVGLVESIRSDSRDDALPRATAWVLPALVVGHFFYWANGGTQYGPRFYYEAYPFVVAFVIARVFGGERGGGRGGIGSRPWARSLLVCGVAIALASLPFMAARQRRVVVERQDLYTRVAEQQIHDALVFVGSPTSSSWPMGIGDLLRNGTAIDGPVIYARDRGTDNDRLTRAFPERRAYLYTREPDSPTGELQPLPSP